MPHVFFAPEKPPITLRLSVLAFFSDSSSSESKRSALAVQDALEEHHFANVTVKLHLVLA